MRLFSNIPLILVLVTTWPLVLMGLVVGCEWLERHTLAAKPSARRRRRGRGLLRLRRARPGQVEDLVLQETAQVVARYLAATGESSPAQHTPVPAKPSRSGAARRT
jgi:hypothetical protein